MPEDSNEFYGFLPVPVCNLLKAEPLVFFIPSFQRGYRWERKQVLDLLEDILSFCSSPNGPANYYLQPLVVNLEENRWGVLDGQQRLTTVLLILKKILSRLQGEEKQIFENRLFDIKYYRSFGSFDNPDHKSSLDGFYLAEAKNTIDRWYMEKIRDGYVISDFENCFIRSKSQKKVNFIWYKVAPGSKRASIDIFNRLNKGKIGLTCSELIKALFVLDLEKYEAGKGNDETASSQLVMEWNEFEKKFQDDKFWFFLSNGARDVQTRIDLLFDFYTEKPDDAEDDYSYRLFQNLFDSCHAGKEKDSFWAGSGVDSMIKAWRGIKSSFNRLLSWYEDNSFYHYVGFLVSQGSTPLSIYKSLQEEKNKAANCSEWTKQEAIGHLRKLIRDKFKNKNVPFNPTEIDDLEYDNGDLVKRLLLLFNIEICVKSHNQRFDFDKYKNQKWDIEHIDSRNTPSLQKPEDQIEWLRHIKFILSYEKPVDEIGKQLLKKCTIRLEEFDKLPYGDRSFREGEYENMYKEVVNYYSPSGNVSGTTGSDLKDNINNLTLLNSRINRSYKDAPFPYKRYVIIETDREGLDFIPIGTRNLFLKYFTSSKHASSALLYSRWNADDKKGYMESIHSVVDSFFK